MTRNFGFDTRLNARAFAQAKFAQCITEPGLIVRPTQAPPDRIELWKASGVREEAGAGAEPTMVVWGPPVEGERLDALLAAPPNDNEPPDKVLAAISLWIQSILALGEDTLRGGEGGGGSPVESGSPQESLPLWPCAAIITQATEGRLPSVFFAPPALIRRSVTLNDESYVNPSLSGMEAAAFTAAAMLYRLFTGAPPFTAADISTLHEDMRDGNFLPPHLAVPGLDSRLASLIQAALERRALAPPVAGEAAPAADCGLGAMLAVIQTGGQIVPAASLVQPVSEPDRLLLEKEKAQFLKIKTASIKARRFVARNTAFLLGILAAAAAAAFIVYSIISARAHLPTTAGMEPVQVIESYYHGFGELDHQMMEACVIGSAGKNDINAVVNLFVMSKTRQAYERNAPPIIFPAHEWQGGDLPDVPLFGAADLRIEWLGSGESGEELHYRADYTFWVPAQAVDEAAVETGADDSPLSRSYHYRDFLTLVRKKGNWRIAAIDRVLGMET